MFRHHASLRIVPCGDRRELHGADGAVVNDLDVVDGSTSPFQVILCESCRDTRCAYGHLHVIRRAGDAVVWLPEDDGISGRPRPQLFTGEAVSALLSAVGGHPPLAALPALDLREVAELLRDGAPGQAFGRPAGRPSLQEELIVAVDGAERGEVIAQLAALARAAGPWTPPPPDARPVDVYLDLPGTPAWTPLARSLSGWFALPFGWSHA